MGSMGDPLYLPAIGSYAVGRFKAKEGIPDDVMVNLLRQHLKAMSTQHLKASTGMAARHKGSLNKDKQPQGVEQPPAPPLPRTAATGGGSRWLIDGFPVNRMQVETLSRAYSLSPDWCLLLPYEAPPREGRVRRSGGRDSLPAAAAGANVKAHRRLCAAFRDEFGSKVLISIITIYGQ